MQNMLETLWPTIIGWIMVLCGGCFALWRWIISQRVQRAQFLDLLIEKFKSIKYDDFLRRIESSYENSLNYDDEADDEVGAYDFLIFLSYVCYLRQAKIIDDKEFLLFRCYVERALRINTIHAAIEQIHDVNHIAVDVSPYAPLLTYGRKKKIQGVAELCSRIDKNFNVKQAETCENRLTVISVNDGKSYRTHLEVLNGIFNKGLLQHASGGSPLNANTNVWFPHIYKDKDAAGGRLWYNTLSDDGLELREHCTDSQGRFGGGKDKPNVLRRYVFAKFMDESPGEYRFIGVFDFKEKERAAQNEICWLYIRTADSFDTNSIR